MSELFQVGLFDELEAIYPDTQGTEGEKVYKVSAASGTYAGIHMVVSGLKAGQIVSVEAKGPHGRYKFFEMITVPVEENSGLVARTELYDGKYNPHVIRRAPFMIYEVLRPIRTMLISQGENVAIAFREQVKVEKNVEEKWEIYVTVDGMTQKLTFIVVASAVLIPPSSEETHKYVNWINFDHIATYHKVTMWSPQWEHITLDYLKLARYARQNILWLPAGNYVELGEDGKLTLNTKKLDTLIKLADKAGLYWLNGSSLSSRKDEEWFATAATIMLTGKTMPGEGEEDLKCITAQLYGYIQERGLQERWIQSFFDEPVDECGKLYQTGASIIRETMPGIKILEANKATEPLVGALDIWCPTVDFYETYLDFYKERVEKGEEVWVYTCLEPTGPYLNRLLDMERLRPVLIEWVNSLYPVTGFLHWGGNWFAVDPYKQSCVCMGQEAYTNFEINYSAQLPAGDCGVIYPGDFIGLSTTRLEAHRIGFEDLYLIEQIKAKDEARARAIVEMIARGYKDYETDIKLYREAKKLLIEEVEKLEV